MESCEFNLKLQPNSCMWENLVVYLRGEVSSTDTSQKRWLANNPSNNWLDIDRMNDKTHTKKKKNNKISLSLTLGFKMTPKNLKCIVQVSLKGMKRIFYQNMSGIKMHDALLYSDHVYQVNIPQVIIYTILKWHLRIRLWDAVYWTLIKIEQQCSSFSLPHNVLIYRLRFVINISPVTH